MQCPLRRAIKPGHVPLHYFAQVQTLLEVLDLEVAHFVEYRPETTFSAQEFVVAEVNRDKEWFAKYLPAMISFHAALIMMDAPLAVQPTIREVKEICSLNISAPVTENSQSGGGRWLGSFP